MERENWETWQTARDDEDGRSARMATSELLRQQSLLLQELLARAQAAEAALASMTKERDSLRIAYDYQDAGRAKAEAALAAFTADCQTETDDLLADCAGELERVKAALAALPIEALRSIALRERHMVPPTEEVAALIAWLKVLP